MRAPFAILLCASTWLTGRVSDHGELAEQPGSGGAAQNGSGGRTAVPDASDDARFSSGGSGGEPTPMTDTGTPSGTLSSTFFHGVMDPPWIAFCAAPVHGGKLGSPGKPFPAGGLDYGHSVALDAI